MVTRGRPKPDNYRNAKKQLQRRFVSSRRNHRLRGGVASLSVNVSLRVAGRRGRGVVAVGIALREARCEVAHIVGAAVLKWSTQTRALAEERRP